MNGEIEGVADILTGAAVARAVESHAGEGQAAQQRNCLNCGTTLNGAHCHACGQKAQVHRTLRAFGHDILHSVLHFDGKIWRTMPLLLFKPGELTRRYVHGERARFVSPLALFLFTVFLTFAIFNWLVPDGPGLNPVINANEAEKQYQDDRDDILKDIAGLESDKKAADASQQPGRGWMDSEIARHRNDLKALEESRGREIRQSELATRKIARAKAESDANIARLEAELAAAKAAGKPTAAIEEKLESETVDARLMSNALAAFGQSNGQAMRDDWRFTDLKFWGSDSLNAAVKHAAENPQLLIYKIQSNAYKYSWALIPISIPFVWLLFFWRRRFKIFDHAVFVTYSLCFMMTLGAVSAIILSFASADGIIALVVFLLVFVPPIHIYKQLKYAYGLGRFGAMWRCFALSMFALAALSLFASLIITLGVTG